MNDIYKKIKSKYPDQKVDYDKDKELIAITKDNVKVEAYKDTIHLIVDNKYITHCHTNDFDTKEELYDTIEYYLKDYKQIIKKYKKQNTIKKMIFIIPIVIVVIVAIILVCISENKEKNYYQELKDSIQEDIRNYIKISSPYCSAGSATSSIDEEILIVQAGIDKNKFLDIDGKSYCKVKVNIRCVAENEHDFDTYIKCKDYEDEEYSRE